MANPLLPLSSLIPAEDSRNEDPRLAALQTAVTDALIRGGRERDVLHTCAAAFVKHLDAAFARIWTFTEATQMLELQASAGLPANLDGPHARVPIGSQAIGLIARERRAQLTNVLESEPQAGHHDRAQLEGMVAFAGCPLLADERLMGVIALYARHPLTEATLAAMTAVSGSIALGIERGRAETERERALVAAEYELEHLRNLFHQAPALMCHLSGPDHVYDIANPHYLQLVGRRHIVGKPIREALPELAGQGFYELLDSVYTTGEAFEGRELLGRIDRDGKGGIEDVYFNFIYQPTHSADGSIDGILVHGVDVTDQVRARQAVEAAVQMRNEFLGAISHDLRTPLTTIKGLVQLGVRQAARMDTLEASRLGERLRRVDGAVDRMSGMVDELLDVTRLEAGRSLDLERETVDFVALTERVIREQQEGASLHRITLRSEVPALLGLWDAARLERVLANLLSNAVKFSPDGGDIQLVIAPVPGESGVSVKLTMQDHGIGIPTDDLAHIFERFHRGSNVIGRIKGVGIGLAGVKQIVERHGGTITIASVEGHGATATLLLPAVTA